MKIEFPESGHAETFVAVMLGAVLATLGGVLANLFEMRLRRKEREKDTALLFGHTLAAMRRLLTLALLSLDRGERWGGVTRRMLRAVRRELDIWDRNREALMDLADSRLRLDLHVLYLRLAMPLDGILDSFDQSDPDEAARERGVEALSEEAEEIPGLIERISRVAGENFKVYEAAE